MAKSIYQIKVVLRDIKPKIWRELLIPSDVLLSDLHKILQTTMGWTNSHLHQFNNNMEVYAPAPPDDVMWEPIGMDYTGIRLNDLLTKPKEKIIYEYDFGDGWQHEITLGKILPEDKHATVPVITAGARHCPPEDCGGPWGYSELLEILNNPSHEEYESYIEWMPAEFDPEYFDKQQINKALKKDDYGCITFF